MWWTTPQIQLHIKIFHWLLAMQMMFFCNRISLFSSLILYFLENFCSWISNPLMQREAISSEIYYICSCKFCSYPFLLELSPQWIGAHLKSQINFYNKFLKLLSFRFFIAISIFHQFSYLGVGRPHCDEITGYSNIPSLANSRVFSKSESITFFVNLIS